MEENEALDTSQETAKAEPMEGMEDSLEAIPMKETSDVTLLVKELIQTPQDKRLAANSNTEPAIVSINVLELAQLGGRADLDCETAGTVSSKPTNIDLERVQPMKQSPNSKSTIISSFKTSLTLTATPITPTPEKTPCERPTNTDNTIIVTLAANTMNQSEPKYTRHPTRGVTPSMFATQAVKPPVMISQVATVPITIDLTNSKVVVGGLQEFFKPITNGVKPSQVPPRLKITDLSVDVMATVKVPVARRASSTAKPPLVSKTKAVPVAENRDKALSTSVAVANRSQWKRTCGLRQIRSRVVKKKTVDFRLRVCALWKKKIDRATEWMRTVSDRELFLLGGDRNLLFDLLLHCKEITVISSEVLNAVVHAASKRVDLFTENQLQTITELAEVREEEKEEDEMLQACWKEAERVYHRPVVQKNQSEPNYIGSTFVQCEETKVLEASVPISNSMTELHARPHSPSYSPSEALQAFLDKQHGCLKGTPEDFCHWLWILGIITLEDLASALMRNELLWKALQHGNGKTGVKKFKSSTFKKAVTAVVLENNQVRNQLLCPISQVLSSDTVVAADGLTCEHSIIQVSEFEATKQTFCPHSPHPTYAIIASGFLSKPYLQFKE